MLITKLSFIGVPDIEEQYRRPFELSSNDRMLDSLENALDRTGVAHIRPSALANAISDGMRFSTDKRENANIAGGWSRHRYRFILELEIEQPSRRGTPGSRVVVTGYTESADRSLDGESIPSDMRMYVNGVIGLRDTYVQDRGRERIESEVQKPYQILRGLNRRQGKNDILSRPSDLFRTLEIGRQYGKEKDGVDLRVMFRNGVETSGHHNNTRGGYLARVIRADFDGRVEASVHGTDVFSRTRNTIATDALEEPSLTYNDFIQTLISFQPDMRRDGSFLYEDLIDFTDRRNIKSLDDVTHIMPFDENEFDYESISWKGGDGATMAAITLSRELPALMIDRCLSSIVFIVDNEHLDRGEPEYEAVDWTSYVTGLSSNTDVADGLVRNVIRDIIEPLTRNHKVLMYVRVEYSAEGMITMDIEWDGSRRETFNFPAFADALVPPTYTSDGRNLHELASRYDDIRRKLIDPLISEEVESDNRTW